MSPTKEMALNLDEVAFVRAGFDAATSWLALKSGKEIVLSPDEARAVIAGIKSVPNYHWLLCQEQENEGSRK